MEKIVIFGNSSFALNMYEYLKNDYEIVAFTVDKEYIKDKSIFGLPVIPFENIQDEYDCLSHKIVVCVGYTNMNDIRKVAIKKSKDKGYKLLTYINRNAVVLTKKENIGEGTIILESAVIGINSILGCGNIIYPNAVVAHDTVVGDYNFLSISSSIAGNVIIKNNCFFGNNSCVRDGLIIDDYTLIGAGCYISKDTRKNEVYTPARAVLLEGNSKNFL